MRHGSSDLDFLDGAIHRWDECKRSNNRVTAKAVVDFSAGFDPQQWSPIWSEAYCNGKGLAFLDQVEPPSWVIGDLVRAARHPGILYRSARDPDSICLVLYPELADQFSAPVFDPNELLPRNADSWKASS